MADTKPRKARASVMSSVLGSGVGGSAAPTRSRAAAQRNGTQSRDILRLPVVRGVSGLGRCATREVAGGAGLSPRQAGRCGSTVTLEDKIVQGALAEVLSAIYEVDFLGFSYGFRPGRNPHRGSVALAGCRRARARCLPIRPRGRTPGGRGPAAPACRWRARHAPVPWPASPSPRRRPASAARSQSSETRASALSGA